MVIDEITAGTCVSETFAEDLGLLGTNGEMALVRTLEALVLRSGSDGRRYGWQC